MKVVFDTNVLISGFLTTTGVAQYAFRLGLKRHNLIISEFIIDELRRKLTQKLGFSDAEISGIFHLLEQRATLLHVPLDKKISFSDKKDIPILSLVKATQSHYLVTGDKKLLALKKFGSTLILSPRESLEVL